MRCRANAINYMANLWDYSANVSDYGACFLGVRWHLSSDGKDFLACNNDLLDQTGFAAVDQDYQIAQGDLHEQTEILEEFVTAAMIIGRAQFLPGTPEREVIDAIPTEPAQQPAEQAVILVASSPAAGSIHLVFDAERATQFDVLQKGPGDPDFSVVANDIIVKVYDATGLAAGSYDFKVVGRNSQGPGPESAVSTIVVA